MPVQFSSRMLVTFATTRIPASLSKGGLLPRLSSQAQSLGSALRFYLHRKQESVEEMSFCLFSLIQPDDLL